MSTRSVITIGNFDGVHAGHTALVRRAREIASSTGTPDSVAAATPAGATHSTTRVVAMTFDPHPLTVLRPEAAPARLTTFERKSTLLRAAGADEVVRLMPDAATLGLTPEQFVERVVREHTPVAFVEGATFRFGHDRAGDTRTLADLGRKFGFTVEVVAAVEVTLSDMTVVPATSSLARWLIGQGRVRDAGAVLGRPYAIDGEVVPGERRGRVMGFPTANIRTECLVPGDGVYAGTALLKSGRQAIAAISVGTKPTFGEGDRTLEAFLFDGDARPSHGLPAVGGEEECSAGRCRPSRGTREGSIAGLPEYGWKITLEFAGWVRDQVRFASVEALVEQIGRDCERVREIVAGEGPSTAVNRGWGPPREAAGCK